MKSGAESAGGCVKLKTFTEIRRSSARDTFIAESVYLVLNSLLDWKPVEKIQTEVLCGQFYVCIFQYEASPTVLYATKAEETGRPERRGLK